MQEYTYKGDYTYVYTDQDSYEPLAQVFLNSKDEKQYLAYFHNDQIGIPREMTDQFGNLLWYGEYSAWGRLKKDERIYKDVHQPFRLQNQYCDAETGLHYNFFRYYEPDTGRFVNQDPIGLVGGDNLYFFSFNAQGWIDPLGLIKRIYKNAPYHGTTDNPVKSRAPTDGQAALDNSVRVKPTSHRQVGIDVSNGEIVVLDRTRKISDKVEEFHGHVREWDDLHIEQQKALKKAKKVDKKGRIINQEEGVGKC